MAKTYHLYAHTKQKTQNPDWFCPLTIPFKFKKMIASSVLLTKREGSIILCNSTMNGKQREKNGVADGWKDFSFISITAQFIQDYVRSDGSDLFIAAIWEIGPWYCSNYRTADRIFRHTRITSDSQIVDCSGNKMGVVAPLKLNIQWQPIWQKFGLTLKL